MSRLTIAPPGSRREPVTEVLHGVPVVDPYRWLEDQDSPETRAWLAEQTHYARTHLDHIPARGRILHRIRELLDVETHDSLQEAGGRYFFRKRMPDQEQPSIYMREGAHGKDQLLLDPAKREKGKHVAVRPLRISSDGRLMMYEVKEGGERTGTFELLDIEARQTLPDILPRGYLRGFAFRRDGTSFYYVHEPLEPKSPRRCAAYRHVLGTAFNEDREIFCAGEAEKLQLCLLPGPDRLGLLVYRFGEIRRTDFYVVPFEAEGSPRIVVADADYSLGPLLLSGRTLVITDRGAPNLRIVEIRTRRDGEPEWVDVVPEADARIHEWTVAGNRIFVSYIRGTRMCVSIFDFEGRKTGELLVGRDETVRFLESSAESEELLIETESFAEPIGIYRCSTKTGIPTLWARRSVPFDARNVDLTRVWYKAKDGTRIPMFLMGSRDVLAGGRHPTIITSYGGHGVSMTPQFSVFVAFLVERKCLLAIPNIRGGSEFGAAWHDAAKRRNRQTAYDDFLCAVEWLINTGRTTPAKLGAFGSSNSGLLVGAVVTQRPELFRAVISIVPLFDMLRYHLFDCAYVFREEFGTADDPADFAVLRSYSPYHRVREGAAYPAAMIVSGDLDQNCNPLHARKMTARLQAANSSSYPILLDYSPSRGHSPVLPLSDRIEALTDRVAFLADQLELQV